MKPIKDIMAERLNLLLDIINEHPILGNFKLKGVIEEWLEKYYANKM